MVLGTSRLRRYPVDEIMEPTLGMLLVPWGRTRRKKDVAQGVVQPPDPKARYHGKPILPDYALVEMAWTHDDFEEDELDFPTEEGARLIDGALGLCVLWNKADIVLKMPTLASQPS
jgi:hypothetical protein